MKIFSALFGGILLLLSCNFLSAGEPPKAQDANFTLDNLRLEGELVDDENITFTLTFSVEAKEAGSIPMVSGKVTELSSDINVKGSGFLWLGGGEFKIVFKDGGYLLVCDEPGKCEVKFTFAAKVEDAVEAMPLVKNQQQLMPQPETRKGIKTCSFLLAPAIARSIQVKSARKDLDLAIGGGLNLEKKDLPGADGAIFTAVLPPEGALGMTWRGQVEKITANLVTSVQATTIAEVFPGTVKLSSQFIYTVIQGRLSSLEIKVSQGLNILSVNGENIQDWKVNEDKDNGNTLVVSLSKYYEDSYSVVIESEKVLPDFPSKFSLPTAVPQKALRIDGYLAFGTNGAIKLIVDKTGGLSQIDNSSFPSSDGRKKARELPRKSLFTYKFSGEKYSLDTSADNIMPNYTVDLNYVLTFKDEDLLLRANCSLDIKDAPLRELLVRYAGDTTVNRVEGRSAMADDYETFEKDGAKWLKIPFMPDTIGKTDLFINFEKSMKNTQATPIPKIFIDGAKNVRGHILLAANRGLSLTVEDLKNLRKYPTGSAPLREPGLQHNLRFKDQEWEGKVSVVREQVNIVSEVFHIGSVGEGTIYGSSIFTYHVSGAPIDKIQLKISASVKNLEFTGGNIVDWKLLDNANSEEQTWQVNFREKIFGDYTLLATYETPLSGSDTKYRMGELTTAGAGAETGFMALTSARNLKVSSGKTSDGVAEIEASEIPDEYKVFLQNPILKAYHFTLTPHWIEMNISGYASQQMINIAVDHAKFATRIDRNGQAVTVAEYRIKNSSLQFLAMELPAKSEMWTVKVNGEKKRISLSNGKFLVPLPRNKNTDDPIAVEVTYAEKNGELGKASDLKFTAPVLGLETMFSRWIVEVPENYNLHEYGGNMVPMGSPQRIGLGGIVARFAKWMHRLAEPAVFVPWLMFTLIGGALVWSWTRGSFKILITTVSVIALGIVFIASLAFLEHKIHGAVPEFLPEPVNSCEFTRLFSLPQDTPKIEIHMTDMKATSFLKVGFAMIMGLFGAVLLGIGMLMTGRLKSTLLIALGAVFILSALSYWLYLNAITAFALAALVPFILTLSFWRMIYRKYRKVVATCLILGLVLPFAGQSADKNITIDNVSFKISVAITDNDKSITGTARYLITADKGAETVFLPAPAVLTGGTPKLSGLEIIRNGANYMIRAESSGEYEFEVGFLLPVVEERSGNFSFPLTLPAGRRNSVSVRTSRENMEISSPEAVFFKSSTVNNTCTADASFVPGSKASFKFRPQVRRVEKEKTVFFTSIDALAKFASGFVETKYCVNFQVAQGETAKFAVEVPANMRVTSVSAPDLGAWRFVDETHLLEVFLSQPHHGNFTATVVTQIANCNLPYETKIGTLSVKDAGKQYGTLGVSAESNVQVLVDDKLDGFNSINLNDFTSKFAEAGATIKKAFRYNKPPASITVKASAVEPELRVKENYTVSFEEEKTLLVSDLALEIAKSGIFSVSLDIPANYEIDKVSGSDVQHWDEISEKDVHKILVHFDKSICGNTGIHVELSLSERKRDKTMTIPKIAVVGAQKNKGDLTISLERGTRMDVVSRQGLEIKTEGFGQSREKSAHRFSIVRSDWELKVSFDVIAPWIQAEVLQIGKVTEGVVEYDAHFHYSIENAGVKSFLVRLPENAETPEFTGANMADPTSKGKNLWEIELHQKVSGKYMLQVHYRVPYDKNSQVKIAPVVTEGTELQKGYLAVLSDDSLQVKMADKKGEISEFDIRKIPAYFKVNYLSNAVMCFRTVGNDYSVTLDAIRHKAADQLKAQIKGVNISSVVSPEGRVITSAQVSLINGNQTFLEMRLPEGSTLWSVLIDNQPVDVAQEKGNLLIPLRQGLSGSGRDQSIEIIYSLQTDKSWSLKNQVYNGPSFNIPLRNVSWNLYLPKDFEYSKFGGTLDYFDRSMTGLTYINLEDYDRGNEMYNSENRKNAKVMLSEANKLAAKGMKQEAFEYFRSASTLSANDAELNADVQGQWQQVQRDNSIMGLFGRRGIQKKGKPSVQDEMINAPIQQPMTQQKQVEDINIIKQQLGGAEVGNLQTISDKIFQQQQAAAAVPHPLRLTIPEGGTKLEFRRALQMTPFAPTQISFKAKKLVSWRDFSEIYAGTIIVLGIALVIVIARAALKRKE